jgi:hypothetical protein
MSIRPTSQLGEFSNMSLLISLQFCFIYRKQCNDYEALETTTTATGSVTNLSSITSLSEAPSKPIGVFIHQQFSCQKIEKQNNNNNTHTLNNSNNNNNELISRSSKITEELEMKLKERRMLTECISGDENVEEESEISINEKKQSSNDQHHDSCSCQCHHHDHKKKSNCQVQIRNKKANNNNNINNLNSNYNKHQASYHHRQIVNNEDNIQTTDENSPTFTPSKRESIRKLMENKAVSENKQKNELERHLTSMLISRINSCEIID